jgi:hypothetical protein
VSQAVSANNSAKPAIPAKCLIILILRGASFVICLCAGCDLRIG